MKKMYTAFEAAKKINVPYKRLLYMISIAPRNLFYESSGVKKTYSLTQDDIDYFTEIIQLRSDLCGIKLSEVFRKHPSFGTQSTKSQNEPNNPSPSADNDDEQCEYCDRGQLYYELRGHICGIKKNLVALQYMCIVLLMLLGCLVFIGSLAY